MGNNPKIKEENIAISAKHELLNYLEKNEKELIKINKHLAKHGQLTDNENQKLKDFLMRLSEAYSKNVRFPGGSYIGLITNVYTNIRRKNLYQDTPEFRVALFNIYKFLNQLREVKNEKPKANSQQRVMPPSPEGVVNRRRIRRIGGCRPR